MGVARRYAGGPERRGSCPAGSERKRKEHSAADSRDTSQAEQGKRCDKRTRRSAGCSHRSIKRRISHTHPDSTMISRQERTSSSPPICSDCRATRWTRFSTGWALQKCRVLVSADSPLECRGDWHSRDSYSAVRAFFYSTNLTAISTRTASSS